MENYEKPKNRLMKKGKLNWDGFDYCITKISERYQGTKLKMIIGVTRGGLVPATKLSHLLNVPMKTLTWQTRDTIDRDIEALLRLKRVFRSHEVLFVDDICDTGDTIRQIRNYFPGAVFTTLIDNLPEENKIVDFSPMTGDSAQWTIFPWEE